MKKTGKKKIKLFSRKHSSTYGTNMDHDGFEGSVGPMKIDRNDHEPSFDPEESIGPRKS